jgi:hypothetical protein
VDRSLWLLIQLRLGSAIRRRRRDLATLKGALLIIAAGIAFLPAVFATFFAPRLFIDAQVAQIEQHGALAMLAFCVLNVLATTGERAVRYSMAEIEFLFCGPYRPHHVLLYKLAIGLAGCFATAGLFTLFFAIHTRWLPAAFSGVFVALVFLYLFTMAVSLFATMVGTLAFDRTRKVLLLAILCGLLAGLAAVGKDALQLPLAALIERLERSPAMAPLLAVFHPFVRSFTATRGAELAGWGAVAAAIDLLMGLLVIGLSGQYYEATATANLRRYERLRGTRNRLMFSGQGKYRFGLPMPPVWGGIGPLVWRQATMLTRSAARLIALTCLFLVPVLVIPIFRIFSTDETSAVVVGVGSIVAVSLLAPTIVGYDFRADFGRMEVLKVLPLTPTRIVVGQIATPIAVISIAECVSIVLVAAMTGMDRVLAVQLMALTVPSNMIALAVDNLAFLCYPASWVPASPGDVAMVVRLTIVVTLKIVALGFVAGVAGVTGAGVYFASGGQWSPAVWVGWAVACAIGLATVPALAQAFVAYDVAREGQD